MLNGKWFFSCTAFDYMENSIAQAEHPDRTELKADDETAAIKEAWALWAKRSQHIRLEWNGESYPRDPRVFYEVPWPKS